MENRVTRIPLRGYSTEGRSGPSGGSPLGIALAHFVVGPENYLVETAVHSVLADARASYNPVVFHGPTGTGKSHLAHGLAGAWKAQHRRQPVVVKAAIDFVRELNDAVEAQGVPEFREVFRRAAIWIIEDVERLANRPTAQGEFIVLLDEALAAGTRVVVTAATPPAAMTEIAPRLQGRLLDGLTVPLVPPELDARRAILADAAKLRGVPFSEEAIEALARGLRVTAPRLFGAVIQLETAATVRGTAVDLELARKHLARQRGSRRVELRAIAAATARHFALRMSELKSPSRRKVVVYARGVAMFLARELTGGSLNRIGEFFGGRDHATVLHGCRKTEELVKTEPTIRQAVQTVRDRLHAV